MNLTMYEYDGHGADPNDIADMKISKNGYTHTMLIPNGTSDKRWYLRKLLDLIRSEIGVSNNNNNNFPDSAWYNDISPFTFNQRLYFKPESAEQVNDLLVEWKLTHDI